MNRDLAVFGLVCGIAGAAFGFTIGALTMAAELGGLR